MAAISWTLNEIRDYLATRGFSPADTGAATYIQTYVQRLTDLFTTVKKDSSLIIMLERMARIIPAVCIDSYYDGISSVAAINAMVEKKHPELVSMTTTSGYTIGDIIHTDIANLFPSLGISGYPDISTMTAFGEIAFLYLTEVARYMRYFANTYTADANNNMTVGPIPAW